MKTALVVGAGAGGAAAARRLQGFFQVTVLEEGRNFRPFAGDIRRLARLRWTGAFHEPRMISALFPAMRTRRLRQGMILVNGRGLGGTTTLSTGSALRLDEPLRKMGIDLREEFEELEREIPITTHHQRLWSPVSRRLFQVCSNQGLEPQATPKMGDYRRCKGCGRCVLGCRAGAKWDSRRFLADAAARGARVVQGARVEKIILKGDRAAGVKARIGGLRRVFQADLVILAAGGLGTPPILTRSGFPYTGGLFTDPVLCVAAELRGGRQFREPSMPFVIQRKGFMISPYMDWLSFFFDRRWRKPPEGIVSLMIKLSDEGNGALTPHGFDKRLSGADQTRLGDAESLCLDILAGLGVDPARAFRGLLNAGHPGGLLPLTPEESGDLHPAGLPANLFVADASRLPASLGGPNILTLLALAGRIGRICIRERNHF